MPTWRWEKLKRSLDEDLLIFGSRTLWNELLAAGLDEIHLIIGSRLAGAGTPAFEGGIMPELQLIGVRTFEELTNVVLG